ncbi:hypothetical protein B0H11DRAFT_2096396 [Mycena galericulata]|nr:hypothetical protein B0H11DRAFT_2096396 [Mycena galericulata]
MHTVMCTVTLFLVPLSSCMADAYGRICGPLEIMSHYAEDATWGRVVLHRVPSTSAPFSDVTLTSNLRALDSSLSSLSSRF